MALLSRIFGACSTLKKAEPEVVDDVSDIQMNAFEFRNFSTSLEPHQQHMLERVVNTTASSLVKGKVMKVNNFEDKVYLDKDLLTLEYNAEFYPLRSITKMEFFKDTDDMMGAPWVVEVTFEGRDAERALIFNFDHERQRVSFALTMRILRTRDPECDLSQTMEVAFADDEDDDVDHRTFNRIVATTHHNIQEFGIPIVISVSDLKIYTKIQSSSRHVYLELFVHYPNMEKFLYGKSPTTHIPPQVMEQDDGTIRRKKKDKEEDAKDEKKDDKNAKAKEVQEEAKLEALCSMKFDLKNVKLKVPKVPHTIIGRLMAKDDYFPTAVGTFQIVVDKTMLKDQRHMEPDEKAKECGGRDVANKEPDPLGIPMYSAMKVKPQDDTRAKREEGKIIQIGLLNIRLLGYIYDNEKVIHARTNPKANEAAASSEDDDTEEEETDSEEEEHSDKEA